MAENLLLHDPPRNRVGLVRRGAMPAAADAILHRYGVDYIDSDAVTADLSVAQRQIVELVRVLATQPRVLILDEPTAALPDRQVEWLSGAHATVAGQRLLRDLHLPPVAGDRGTGRPGHGVPQRHPRHDPGPHLRDRGGHPDERADVRGYLPGRPLHRPGRTPPCGSGTCGAVASTESRSNCVGARFWASAGSPDRASGTCS